MAMRPGDPLSWCYVGQKVLAPCRENRKRILLLCTVVTACGDTARVVNHRFDFDKWYKVYDIYQAIFDPDSPSGKPNIEMRTAA